MNIRSIVTQDEQFKEFNKTMQYCFMKKGLIDTDFDFISTIRNELKQIIDTVYETCYTYFYDVVMLPVFSTSELESIVKEETHGGNNVRILTRESLDTISNLLKDIMFCVFVATKSVTEYYQKIDEAEKVSARFLVSILSSFGLYEEFFKLPIPVLRKLLRVLVHIYKYKGTRYSLHKLVETISYSKFFCFEFFSFGKKPYDSLGNLFFGCWREVYKIPQKVFIHLPYNQVVDQRWWTLPHQYSTFKTKD